MRLEGQRNVAAVLYYYLCKCFPINTHLSFILGLVKSLHPHLHVGVTVGGTIPRHTSLSYIGKVAKHKPSCEPANCFPVVAASSSLLSVMDCDLERQLE